MKKFKIEFKWAFIFVAMMLLWMLIEKLTGLHGEHIDQHKIFTNFVAIPAVIIYVLALMDKRENYFGGKINYKQAFTSGLIITAIITALSPFTQIITVEVISPDYFNNMIDYVVEQEMYSPGEARIYFNLKSYILQTLWATPIMGIITTAIVAIAIRRK